MKIVLKETPQLYDDTGLSHFLAASPLDLDGWRGVRDQVCQRSYCREELSDLLKIYNQSIGNDSIALQQIQTLKNSDSCCVFTGQQLGLMGGPAYTLLKAITCLSVARSLNAIPIFWLATEDHDVGEIDHTFLLDPVGNLKKNQLNLPKDGRFVEDLEISDSHKKVIDQFLYAVDLSEWRKELFKEKSYGRLMAKVLVKLFAGTGLVFLEPYLLRPLAKSFFSKEITECDEITSIIQRTTKNLIQAGGKQILDMQEGTQLFIKMEGKYRCKIHRKGKKFQIRQQTYTEQDLLSLVEKEPERFSTNVAARPVLQCALFPTITYVAGPNEMAYYYQLKEYHEYHGVPMPWIIPRLSATFITPRAQEYLETCRLNPWDTIPVHWSSLIPKLKSPELYKEWKASAMDHFGEELSDQTLSRFIRYAIQNLENKVGKIRLRQQGIPTYALHYLRNLFHPKEKLQERVLNWLEFQSQSKENLVQEMLRHADWRCRGHHYCYL